MRWLAILGAMVIGVVGIGFVLPSGRYEPIHAADGDIKKSPRTITASGIGLVKANADQAKITFCVFATDPAVKGARETLEKNSKKVKEAIDGLKFQVDIKHSPIEITHAGFGGGPWANVAPQINPPIAENRSVVAYTPVPPQPMATPPAANDQPIPDPFVPGGPGAPIAPGQQPSFQATQLFTLYAKNNDPGKLLENVNKILQTIAESGCVLNPNSTITTMNYSVTPGAPKVAFIISNEAEVRRKALTQGVTDAMANAKALAQGAELKLAETSQVWSENASQEMNEPYPGPYGPGMIQVGENLVEREISVKVTVVCSY
jgi:uncharacterized protein YggE